MNTCGVTVNDSTIIGSSLGYKECIRPEGHDEPHLIQRDDGECVTFENDLMCGCEYCMSEEPDDWCQIIRYPTNDEVRKMLV
jgi:hypothetical protein